MEALKTRILIIAVGLIAIEAIFLFNNTIQPTDVKENWVVWAFHDPTAFFTFFLVGATGGLVYVTWSLTQATVKLVKGAEDTAVRQLRAYLTINGRQIAPERDHFIFKLKNFGQTPAYEIVSFPNWTWRKRDASALPPDFSFRDYMQADGRARTYCGPGQEVQFTFDISSDLIAKAEAGDIKMYLYGHFDYTDAFKTKRTIRYCFECLDVGTKRERLRVYTAGNYSD